MLEHNILHIYTDGACKPNPGDGGYAVRFVYLEGETEKHKDFEYSGVRNTTNNEMELTGVIKGLNEAIDYKNLSQYASIIVFTDSTYV
jgi:ribonuclease HI